MSAKLILTEICVGDGIVPDCEAINTFHYQTDMYVIIIAHVNVLKKKSCDFDEKVNSGDIS